MMFHLAARAARLGLDRYMLLLIISVICGSLLPARGAFAIGLSQLTFWSVALLFFLYGAKLSTSTIWSGLTNWRLQIAVFLSTFALFPLLGMALYPLATQLLPVSIGIGVLYLCAMPSTVQSAIAFTAVSQGNVAGAVCAASLSNLLGVVLSPLLVGALATDSGSPAIDPAAFWKIIQQILLPFACGKFCQPLLRDLLVRHKGAVLVVDRGAILLIVYAAFSAGRVTGVWQKLGFGDLIVLLTLCAVLLAVAMLTMTGLRRALGMDRADGFALLYCGSTKSLATGLPMAGILFAPDDLSLVILPLMLFHLMQLFVCALISQRGAWL